MPTGKIPIICAAQSDAGTRFAAEYVDYNFCTGGGTTLCNTESGNPQNGISRN